MKRSSAALSLRGILAFKILSLSWSFLAYGSKMLYDFHQIRLVNWRTSSIETLISMDNENLFKSTQNLEIDKLDSTIGV